MFSVGIDPGHGGSNLGTKSLQDITEAEYVLILAHRLASVLSAHGIDSKLSRQSDETCSFQLRAQRLAKCSFNLVLHVNAYSTPKAHGLECYHRGNDSLAVAVAETIIRHRPSKLYKKNEYSIIDVTNSPTDSSDDWLENPENTLEKYERSALLVELGYGTNASDREYLLRS